MAWMWKVTELLCCLETCSRNKKSLVVVALVVVVSLIVVMVNYSEKSYILLEPMFGQTSDKTLKSHLGYVSIVKEEPLKLHCELCSIVSSSGQMLGQAIGAEIDSYPCVMRMNNAPTQGFEDDVGHRTTLRVVSHTSVPQLVHKSDHFFGENNDTIYVVWGPLRNMRKDGKGVVYNMLLKVLEKYPNARIYIHTDERMNYCDTVFKKETGKDRLKSGTYLSTGWFTLILAMDICREIQIYGMINDTYCKTKDYKKVPYHYYETGRRDECTEYRLHENAPRGAHRFVTEKSVFAKWAKIHPIKFFNPSWQLS